MRERCELISTGTSPFDSSLLGVSADGTDAYFFTRDTLVPSDENGSRVKIYDARAGGGFANRSAAASRARPPTSATGRAARRRRRPTSGRSPAPRRQRGDQQARCKKGLVQEARQVREKRHAPTSTTIDSRASHSIGGGRDDERDHAAGLHRRARASRSCARRWRSPRLAAPALAERGDRLLHDDHLEHPGRRSPRPRRPPSPSHNPGAPEAAQNVIFNAPEGLFGNPNAITHCTSVRLRPRPVPVRTPRSGLITVYANYEGDPNYLLGTAPIFDVEPQAEPDGALRLHRADPQHPDQHPGRGAHRRRLRAALHRPEHHPADAARRRRPDLLGLPGRSQPTTPSASRKARPGEPAGCPGLADTSCIGRPDPGEHPGPPAHRQPDHLHRRAARRPTLEVQTYQDPNNLDHAQAELPGDDGLRARGLQPGPLREPDHRPRPTRPRASTSSSAPHSSSASPPRPRRSRRRSSPCPKGFTINPDAADGQSACTDAAGQLRLRGAGRLPRQLQDRHLRDRHPGARRTARRRRLHRRTEARRPVPPLPDRRRASASTPSWSAPFKPDPETGQVTAYFEDLPQVPFDDFQLHLFASDRGLMATPTRCTIYTTKADFFPWNDDPRRSGLDPDLQPRLRPARRRCPGQVRPFNPSLVAGTSNPTPAPSAPSP